ncbi:hypothetical protein QT995_27305 [Microcoleus sp. S36b_A3]|uniref:hypothetical protein n=1 Tax=unclassified Microcoleus TaxID=2642155 RepID=UPI002FCFEB08
MSHSTDFPNGRSQFLTQPASLPSPDFVIGDKVSDHWIDEFEKECIEFGEVVGVCWHPRKQVWAYLVDWTSGQGPDFCYPCFDGHLVIGGNLRLDSTAPTAPTAPNTAPTAPNTAPTAPNTAPLVHQPFGVSHQPHHPVLEV